MQLTVLVFLLTWRPDRQLVPVACRSTHWPRLESKGREPCRCFFNNEMYLLVVHIHASLGGGAGDADAAEEAEEEKSVSGGL